MDVFLKSVAGILVCVVLGLILSKNGKDYSALLIIFVCCMVSITAMHYISRVLTFIHNLEAIGNLNHEMLEILFKTVGIGLIGEITVLICSDAGYSALGKVIQILSSCVILWICLPIFEQLLSLVQEVLGAI